MRFNLSHTPYVANKIALDLVNCDFVEVLEGVELVSKIAQKHLDENIIQEKEIDEEAKEVVEENMDEIEFVNANENTLFWKIKKHICEERGFVIEWEERYNILAQEILDNLLKEELIDFSTAQNRVKNTIFRSLNSFSKIHTQVREVVEKRIANYKRKIIVGSEEYDLMFDKIYQEELQRRGLL